MKQSIKAYHPLLHPLTKLSELVKKAQEEVKMIGCCDGQRKLIRDCYEAGQQALILIGPEGDFTDEELALATNSGFQKITLGASRLRTETAGMVACQSISFVNL